MFAPACTRCSASSQPVTDPSSATRHPQSHQARHHQQSGSTTVSSLARLEPKPYAKCSHLWGSLLVISADLPMQGSGVPGRPASCHEGAAQAAASKAVWPCTGPAAAHNSFPVCLSLRGRGSRQEDSKGRLCSASWHDAWPCARHCCFQQHGPLAARCAKAKLTALGQHGSMAKGPSKWGAEFRLPHRACVASLAPSVLSARLPYCAPAVQADTRLGCNTAAWADHCHAAQCVVLIIQILVIHIQVTT